MQSGHEPKSVPALLLERSTLEGVARRQLHAPVVAGERADLIGIGVAAQGRIERQRVVRNTRNCSRRISGGLCQVVEQRNVGVAAQWVHALLTPLLVQQIEHVQDVERDLGIERANRQVDSGAEIEGLKIYGAPWQPNFPHSARFGDVVARV